MKKLICIAFLLIGVSSLADKCVSGYTKSNGTYVKPYYRTNSNSITSDNYSTKGNINPYTGQVGTKDAYSNSNSNYGTKKYGY